MSFWSWKSFSARMGSRNDVDDVVVDSIATEERAILTPNRKNNDGNNDGNNTPVESNETATEDAFDPPPAKTTVNEKDANKTPPTKRIMPSAILNEPTTAASTTAASVVPAMSEPTTAAAASAVPVTPAASVPATKSPQDEPNQMKTPSKTAKKKATTATKKKETATTTTKKKQTSAQARKEAESESFNAALKASQDYAKKQQEIKNKRLLAERTAELEKTKKSLEDDSSVDAGGDDDTPHPKTHEGDALNLKSPPRRGRHAEAQAMAEEKKKSQQKQPPIKPGIRIQVMRRKIRGLVPIELQKHIPNTDENYHYYYGSVVGRARGNKPTCDITLDCFPNEEVAPGIRRDVFRTLRKGDDEPPIDPRRLAAQKREDEDLEEEVKDEAEIMSEKEFCSQSKEVLSKATSFTYPFKNKKKQDIVWKIHELLRTQSCD